MLNVSHCLVIPYRLHLQDPAYAEVLSTGAIQEGNTDHQGNARCCHSAETTSKTLYLHVVPWTILTRECQNLHIYMYDAYCMLLLMVHLWHTTKSTVDCSLASFLNTCMLHEIRNIKIMMFFSLVQSDCS